MSKINGSLITSWVATNFPDFKTRKGGEQLRINNPLKADDGYHLNISVSHGIVNDWRGNEWVGINPKTGKRNKCTFVRFVQLYLTKQNGRCSYLEALESILGNKNDAKAILLSYKSSEEVTNESNKDELYDIELPPGSLPINFSHILPTQDAVINYLNGRGITNEMIAKNRLMTCGFTTLFPYYEYDELVYWQTRSILDKSFLFPPEEVGVTKGEFLFGFDDIEPASYLIINESIIDKITIGDQSVAIGGADISDKQVQKIRLLTPTDGIIVALDNDKAGLNGIISIGCVLSKYYNIYYSIPPKIPFTKQSGDVEYTKDWNDIQRFTDNDACKLLLENVKPLNVQNKIAIKSMAANSKLRKQTINSQRKDDNNIFERLRINN